MRLQTFLSCWANELDLAAAIQSAPEWGYDGVEGPPPADAEARKDLAAKFSSIQMPYIAEIATGGNYVPAPGMSVQDHLDDLERHLTERVSDFDPVFVNVLGGSDCWGMAECVRFFDRGIELGLSHGHTISWETHRSRPTNTPWATRDLLLELPEMRINCDFSHWCVVCERLVMDEEPRILELCAERCAHLHARVGYDQGPQVPDPRDTPHAEALSAHLLWWGQLWGEAKRRGQADFTVAAEFGPDGYLQSTPFSHDDAADLHELNKWMSAIVRNSFDGAGATNEGGL